MKKIRLLSPRITKKNYLLNELNVNRILQLQKTCTTIEPIADHVRSELVKIFDSGNTSCDLISIRKEFYSDNYNVNFYNTTEINYNNCTQDGHYNQQCNNPKKINYVCQRIYNNFIQPEVIDTYTLRFKPSYINLRSKNEHYSIYVPYMYFNVSVRYYGLIYNNNKKAFYSKVAIIPTGIGYSNRKLSGEQKNSHLFYPYITNVYLGLYKLGFNTDPKIPIPCFNYGNGYVKINYNKTDVDNPSEKLLNKTSDEIITKINTMMSVWFTSSYNGDGLDQLRIHNADIYTAIAKKINRTSFGPKQYYYYLNKMYPKKKVSKMKLSEFGYKFPLKSMVVTRSPRKYESIT